MTEGEGEERTDTNAEVSDRETPSDTDVEKEEEEEESEIKEGIVTETDDEEAKDEEEQELPKSKSKKQVVLEDVEEEEEPEEIELTEEELEALFNKNTESFRCLAQILLSRSSLLRHPLYHFPPLKDPGIDAAFNYVEPEEPVDNICIEKYKKVCKELNIVPLSRVVNSLPTKELNLRYYGLTDKEFKAVARTLQLNTFVEVLDLEENFLDPESAYYIEELLRENNTLKYLNMKECRIGPTGAATLSDGIMLTQSLKELDLSYNDLGTEGLNSLMIAFKDNSTIKRLNLAHNNLDLNVAPIIASILRENIILEELNLAWNNLGVPQAMKMIFDGLTGNPTLRSLGLAWNGICLKTAIKPLTKYLRKTEVLECLDLSNNRINGPLCNMIKNALRKNKSMQALSLAFNPLTPEDAYGMADVMISKAGPPNFNVLDMDNVFVKKGFVPLWKRATAMGKHIKITGVLGNWAIKGPNVSKLLFDRARLLAMKPKRKKMRKDFGHFILALPDKPMKKGDFDANVKKFKMKMVDNDLLAEIAKQFPYKKKGIDCVALKENYLSLYPDTQPPPPKKKKKGKRGKKKKAGEGSTSEITTARKPSIVTPSTTLVSTLEKRKVSIRLSQNLFVETPSEMDAAQQESSVQQESKEGVVGEPDTEEKEILKDLSTSSILASEGRRSDLGLVRQDSRSTARSSRASSLVSEGLEGGVKGSQMFSVLSEIQQSEKQEPLETIQETIEDTN